MYIRFYYKSRKSKGDRSEAGKKVVIVANMP